MKAWLKWGLWTNVVVLVLSLIYWVILAISNVITNPFIIFLLPGVLVTFIVGFAVWGYDIPSGWGPLILIIDILISVVVYFVVGTLLGWIVRKIRQKK